MKADLKFARMINQVFVVATRYLAVSLGCLWFVFGWTTEARACLAYSTEYVNEKDAQVVIEGRLLELQNLPASTSSTLIFQTLKTVRGQHRDRWTVTLRGTRRPQSLAAFVQKFGRELEVGLVLDERSRYGVYVADNACKMNRDDWFLRPLRSYRVLEVKVDAITSSAAASYLPAMRQIFTGSIGGVEGCYRQKKSHLGRRLVQVRVTTRGPGQYLESRILTSEIADAAFKRCIVAQMQYLPFPWTSQNLDERVHTDVTYALHVCMTDSNQVCT